MFRACKNIEDLKELYDHLAIYLHPDRGGDDILMSLLNVMYKLTKDDFETRPLQNRGTGWYELACENHIDHEKILKGDQRLDIIEKICRYGVNHKNFDVSFTFSILEFLTDSGYITSTQYNSLVKIHHSFNIEKWCDSKAK